LHSASFSCETRCESYGIHDLIDAKPLEDTRTLAPLQQSHARLEPHAELVKAAVLAQAECIHARHDAPESPRIVSEPGSEECGLAQRHPLNDLLAARAAHHDF
jgi:hypothetical protein